MEQETAPATRDVSDIENLPAELLEQVLLYVVGDALPPIIKHRGSTTVYRCNDTNQDYVARSLSFRLTCRRFGALSWRALGHFIGETVFDIRSRRSVINLAAVSGCRDLAPWIHKLTIASHQPDEGSPLYGDEAGEAARRNSVETQKTMRAGTLGYGLAGQRNAHMLQAKTSLCSRSTRRTFIRLGAYSPLL
jgi:hypothetical protein